MIDAVCVDFRLLKRLGSGKKKTNKQFKSKLRLNEERLINCKKVVNLELREFENAVCQKCYRKVSTIIQQEEQITKMKSELQATRAVVQQVYL